MADFTSQTLGCFLGKNIGGTLGMPYEGRQEVLDLTYYRPVPTSPAPNDDLDLQLVWLQHVKEHGLDLDAELLGQAWMDHIDAHPDEYGITNWNLRRGLKPPVTGSHNNWFTCGMGAAIRSEIWASLFPGRPATAAWYAWQDAQVDHAGDGAYAEIFLAAMQADLYASRDLAAAIDTGLSFLPDSSRLKRAIRAVRVAHAEGVDYETARRQAMRSWGSHNFTDCTMNLCSIMLGLFYGEGDFERSILCAVNCGQDTDCSGATTGATLGILLGEAGIPEHWRAPIGNDLVVGDYILDLAVPATVEELIDDIGELRQRFADADAPSLDAPFIQPPIEPLSDNIPWLLNGKPIIADSIRVPVPEHVDTMEESVWLETSVHSPDAGLAQLMVASPGMFRCYVDGEYQGVWGAQMPIIPSAHRLCGGRVYNLRLTADHWHHLRLELLPTSPVPDVRVAFTDMENRYLNNLDWRYPEAARTAAGATAGQPSA